MRSDLILGLLITNCGETLTMYHPLELITLSALLFYGKLVYLIYVYIEPTFVVFLVYLCCLFQSYPFLPSFLVYHQIFVGGSCLSYCFFKLLVGTKDETLLQSLIMPVLHCCKSYLLSGCTQIRYLLCQVGYFSFRLFKSVFCLLNSLIIFCLEMNYNAGSKICLVLFLHPSASQPTSVFLFSNLQMGT